MPLPGSVTTTASRQGLLGPSHDALHRGPVELLLVREEQVQARPGVAVKR
jgi:hypothetical protein